MSEPAFYFGTFKRAGHYLWDEWMDTVRWSGTGEGFRYHWPGPWRKLDGELNPNRNEGEAALHHKDGWTALAFANYTDDRRGNSNSAFFFKEILDFEAAVAMAHERFPRVVRRFEFDLFPTQPQTPGTQGGN